MSKPWLTTPYSYVNQSPTILWDSDGQASVIIVGQVVTYDPKNAKILSFGGFDPQFKPAADALATQQRAEGLEVVVVKASEASSVKTNTAVSSVTFFTHGNANGQLLPYVYKNAKGEYKPAGDPIDMDYALDYRADENKVKLPFAGAIDGAKLSKGGLVVFFGCEMGDANVTSLRGRLAREKGITIAGFDRRVWYRGDSGNVAPGFTTDPKRKPSDGAYVQPGNMSPTAISPKQGSATVLELTKNAEVAVNPGKDRTSSPNPVGMRVAAA